MSVTPQTNATLNDIAAALLAADRIMISGHVNPDGDCIGSQLALAAALEACGKEVVCLLADEGGVEESLCYLQGAKSMVFAEAGPAPADVFVAVDVPTYERMGASARYHRSATTTITIDHHANEERISDFTYVDPESASTTMMIWQLIGLFGIKITSAMAECCYAGLMTDTGGFRFQNADFNAFAAAAEMVAAGASPAKCAFYAYENVSLVSLKLTSLALDHARMLAGGQGVISYVTADEMEALGALKADAEPLIDTLRSMRGVRVACMLRGAEGQIRGSLRSKDTTDVAAIACKHGGGGHKAAAGFRMELPMEAAVAALSKDIEDALR